jgi:two-component system sensor histidine kinase BaeS
VRQTGPLAQTQQLQLHAVLAGAELLVEADPDRLHQVLLILLDNAIAHTPADGAITVGVAQQGSMGIITVVDTGEGIAAADLPRIFDRFYRDDGARARTTGGTGLGLAIAQALVTSHGGQISAASTPGRGTTMTLALPLLHQPQTLANRLGQIAARAVGRDRPYPKVADD